MGTMLSHWRDWNDCCRKGDPFQGPRVGSCLSFRNELSKDLEFLTLVDKARDFTGKGRPGGEQQVREPRRTALPCAQSLGFYGNGVSFWVVSCQSLWLRVLPGGTCIAQPKWLPVRRILGGHVDWCLFSPFGLSQILPFVTRTSCCKITCASGYYGAWLGRAVSVSGTPNTITTFLCRHHSPHPNPSPVLSKGWL